MKPLLDWPIYHKFLAGTLLIALPAILLLACSIILLEHRTMRQARLDVAEALINTIATNAPASLFFDDKETAHQILAGVATEPGVVLAALFDRQGQLYASFPTNPPAIDIPVAPTGRPRRVFGARFLESSAVMMHKGRRVGSAFLRMDLQDMHMRFRAYVSMVALVAAGAVLLSILLSRILHRWVGAPLLALSSTAKAIAEQRNYSLRAEKRGADELGDLVDAFNLMVDEADRAHQEIQRHAGQLEEEVVRRTAELRRIIAELEAFSYSISHDMRAPLRAMQGFAQLIQEDPRQQLSPESAGLLGKIMRAAKRLDGLIQDILNYSRLAQAQFQVAPVNLDGLLDDVLTEYPHFQMAGLRIQIERPLGKVLGHAAALSQVFSNLLSNAIKFVPPGRTPEIVIRSVPCGLRRRVLVQDNGVGIAEKDLQRIFGIFERVHDTKQYEGSGIGLSIVKKAIEKMGGSFGVESQVGSGSTFWFELNDSESERAETHPPG